MKRYRIGLDTDGVKGNLSDLIIADLNANYGTNYEHDNIPEWDIVKKTVPAEELDEWWKRFGREGFVHGQLKPYPGAVDGVKRLQEVADVYVVTSPVFSSKTWAHERNAWLYQNFGIQVKHIVHTSAKYLFYGNMLVDDKTDNVVRWQEEHPAGIGVLWSHSFNAQDACKVKMRTNSWDELYSRVLTEISKRS
jgi:5'(3')-deoxyribonucleotidase